MEHIDLSSLNTVNERYDAKRDLEQARRVTKLARDILIKLLDKTKILDGLFIEMFSNTIPWEQIRHDVDPCSEDFYFEALMALQQEFSRPGICKIELSFNFGNQYGTLEIINYNDQWGSSSIYRHEFAFRNRQLDEIAELLSNYLGNLQLRKKISE